MNDWELLEKVSVVAGISGDHMVRGDGTWVFFEPGRSNWNPLADDGDALRLAVKLKIAIRLDDEAGICAGWSKNQQCALDGGGPWYWKEWYCEHSDEASAWRRAIVEAAAQIVSASNPPHSENAP